MSDFINTVDVLGDEAVINSLIDRTITEYADNNIKIVGSAGLQRCDELLSLNLPSVVTFGAYAVNQCAKLESVSAPLAETIQNYAFQNCTALKEASFPKVTTLGTNAFQNCPALETANFPALETAGSSNTGQFYSCAALKNVSLPKLTAIPNSMFNSAGIEEVVFESALSIATGGFSSCKSLRKADFHVLQAIGSSAFGYCTALEALILRRTESICNLQYSAAISSSAIGKGTGYVYVPRALLDTYKAATNWSTYADRIRAIEDYPDICG